MFFRDFWHVLRIEEGGLDFSRSGSNIKERSFFMRGPKVFQKPEHSKTLAWLSAVLFIVQFVLLCIFVWPATRSAPHRVPLAFAGQPRVIAGLGERISSDPLHAFRVVPAANRAAATKLVMQRKTYGAVIIDLEGATLEIASGASPTIASALQNVLAPAIRNSLPSGMNLHIKDLAANPVKDPHGVGIASSLIPLIITSIAFGSLVGLRQGRRFKAIAGGITFALGAGLVATWTLQSFLGVIAGSFFNNFSVIFLGVLAMALLPLGLVSLLGLRGIPASAVVILVLGFPLSGALGARELLPTPWGTFGSWLPTGAFNSALRSSSFFDLAGSTRDLFVLILWALVGGGLTLIPKKS